MTGIVIAYGSQSGKTMALAHKVHDLLMQRLPPDLVSSLDIMALDAVPLVNPPFPPLATTTPLQKMEEDDVTDHISLFRRP